jgi:hypothetical protein
MPLAFGQVGSIMFFRLKTSEILPDTGKVRDRARTTETQKLTARVGIIDYPRINGVRRRAKTPAKTTLGCQKLSLYNRGSFERSAVETTTPLQKIAEQSSWYGERARRNRSVYNWLKGAQIVVAAAIPVVSVAAPADVQRLINAILGALVGIIEGLIQLGQFQQNWLRYRATREALKREEFLHSANAGPYTGVASPEILFVERCDAIISGENTKWLTSQEQKSPGK